MIVDASVAFKWIFVEEDSAAAAAFVGRDDLFAPTLLLAEIGNALWKKGVRGELGDRQAYSTQLALVASLVVTIDETELMPRALDIALTLDHPIYDCIYLALAEDRGDRLISADRRFLAKVAQSSFASLVEAL